LGENGRNFKAYFAHSVIVTHGFVFGMSNVIPINGNLPFGPGGSGSRRRENRQKTPIIQRPIATTRLIAREGLLKTSLKTKFRDILTSLISLADSKTSSESCILKTVNSCSGQNTVEETTGKLASLWDIKV
jgi:hypothetical protein